MLDKAKARQKARDRYHATKTRVKPMVKKSSGSKDKESASAYNKLRKIEQAHWREIESIFTALVREKAVQEITLGFRFVHWCLEPEYAYAAIQVDERDYIALRRLINYHPESRIYMVAKGERFGAALFNRAVFERFLEENEIRFVNRDEPIDWKPIKTKQ